MNHTEVLNILARHHGYQNYLEIGVQIPENNFNKIICKNKVGVDPEKVPALPDGKERYHGRFVQLTSNDFFRQNTEKFDLIFIDGLHTWEQCVVDIINAMSVLNISGSIVVHDVLPTSKEMQAVPRTTKQWTGDVWKAWVYMRDCYDPERLQGEATFEHLYILDTDFGIGIFENLHRCFLFDDPLIKEFKDFFPEIYTDFSLEYFKQTHT